MLQRDVKEDFDVVQQDNVTFGLRDNLVEDALELERPLPLRQVEQAA